MTKKQRNYEMVRSIISRTLLAGPILLLSAGTYATGNLVMRGALVTEPCVIAPGDENIQLDFGSIVDKYLYLNHRTHGQELKLRLLECDLSVGNIVRVTFSGTESLELPGLLAIDVNSQAKGIAIGLESLEGRAIPFNKAGEKFTLESGESVISINTYIRGEPKSLSQRDIKFGGFNAVATFGLEYE